MAKLLKYIAYSKDLNDFGFFRSRKEANQWIIDNITDLSFRDSDFIGEVFRIVF